MEQTNEKLEEVVQKIEEAAELYQEIVKNMDVIDQNKMYASPSVKSLKVLVNEKRTVLDPSARFEDIQDPSVLSNPVPLGHTVTTFYYRNPNHTNPSYQTEPVSLKPWLGYRSPKQN